MAKREVSFVGHILLLVCFCILMVGMWMLPVLMAGFPHALSGMVSSVRILVETGVLISGSTRLPMHILGLLHPLIGWENMIGWTTVNASVFAVALIPWWWSIQRIFDKRVAWISTILLSFMPMYWMSALALDGYSFAFAFLFLGCALFLKMYPKNKLLAAILFGLCFGAVIASRDAFIALLPWFVVSYLWFERSRWKMVSLEVLFGFVCAYGIFILPLLPVALQAHMSPMETVGVFLDPFYGREPGEEHLYPDDYAYTFLREEFNQKIEERIAGASFFERQEDQHYRIIFGVGDISFTKRVFNSIWLFVNTLPALLQQDTVGGAFMWLFILPGMAVVFVTKRSLFLSLIGLWLSTEFLLRFVLHYGRSHLDDFGWMFAIFASVGLVYITNILCTHWKKIGPTLCTFIIVFLVSMQLLQANRKYFAYKYSRSYVPAVYAASEALKSVPLEDTVIANPRRRELLQFSKHNSVTIHNDTIDYLEERGRLDEPFSYYGVTHIIGYSEEQSLKIISAIPGIQNITFEKESVSIPMTHLMRYLLHVIR